MVRPRAKANDANILEPARAEKTRRCSHVFDRVRMIDDVLGLPETLGTVTESRNVDAKHVVAHRRQSPRKRDVHSIRADPVNRARIEEDHALARRCIRLAERRREHAEHPPRLLDEHRSLDDIADRSFASSA